MTRRRTNRLAIYTRHLVRRYARIGVWWALLVTIYIAVLVVTYPMYLDSGTLDLDRIPKFVIRALEIPDMSILTEYLQARVFAHIPLIMPFFLVLMYANALAGAEAHGTLDILLGNPIPRRQVVLAHWIAATVVLTVLVVPVGVATWGVAQAMDLDLALWEALRGVLNFVPISTAFGTLALVLSAWLRNTITIIATVFAVIFLMFLMEAISNLQPALEWVGRLSFFHYYGRAIASGIPWASSAFLMVISVGMLLVAMRVFERRDIRA